MDKMTSCKMIDSLSMMGHTQVKCSSFTCNSVLMPALAMMIFLCASLSLPSSLNACQRGPSPGVSRSAAASSTVRPREKMSADLHGRYESSRVSGARYFLSPWTGP